MEPRPDILIEAEKIIRAHPRAAGFVGNVQFPQATSIYTTAVHLAGVTYFWDIATKIQEDVPWGVTASLIARRNVNDGVLYNLAFPQTGGGEDIDYCRQKREHSIRRGGEGFWAAPNVVATHPYWNDGRRYYKRFYMWSVGDGALIKLYPELVYIDYAPNAAELLLLSVVASLLAWLSLLFSFNYRIHIPLAFGPSLALSTLLANVLHDCYRHLHRNSDRVASMNTTVAGFSWVLAVVESSIIRLYSEIGRVVGIIQRREVWLLGHRFDWFAGVWGDGPKNEERSNNCQRAFLTILVLAALHTICPY